MEFTDEHILDFSKPNCIIPSWFTKTEPLSLIIGEGDTPDTYIFLDNFDIFLCYPLSSPTVYINYLKENILIINSNPKYKNKKLICLVDVYNSKQCSDFCSLFKNKFYKIVLNHHAERMNLKYINILLQDKGEYKISTSEKIVIINVTLLIDEFNKIIIKEKPTLIDHIFYINLIIPKSIVDDNYQKIEEFCLILYDVIIQYLKIYKFKITINEKTLEKLMVVKELDIKINNLFRIFGYLLLNFHEYLDNDLYGMIILNEAESNNSIELIYYKDIQKKYLKKYLKYKKKYLNYTKI